MEEASIVRPEAYRCLALRLAGKGREPPPGDGSKMTSMTMSVTNAVLKLAEKPPLDVTWDKVMYEIYVRQKIEEGERSIAEGRTISHEDVRKRFGLA